MAAGLESHFVGLTDASCPRKAVGVFPHADIRWHFQVALAGNENFIQRRSHLNVAMSEEEQLKKASIWVRHLASLTPDS